MGLSWGLRRFSDQIQLARYDCFTKVVGRGIPALKSLVEAVEAILAGAYSDEYFKGLSTWKSDFRKFNKPVG